MDAEGALSDGGFVALDADGDLTSRPILTDLHLPGEAIPERELGEDSALGPPIYRGELGALVNKVRKACLRFQRSEVANDALVEIAENHGVQKKFACDVKTGWNSTLYMLQSFLTLEPSLREFHASRREVYPFSHEELMKVRVLIDALAAVDQCVRRLSQEDATMRSADLALQVRCRFNAPDIPLNFSDGALIRLFPTEPHPKIASGSHRLLQGTPSQCVHPCPRAAWRGVASILFRFVVEKLPRTDIDRWMQEVSGEEDLAEMGATESSIPTPSLGTERSKHGSLGQRGG